MNEKIKYVLDRLREPSTWQGLAAILAVLGVQFSPESQDVVVEMFKDIGSLFGSVTAVILVFWKKDTQVHAAELKAMKEKLDRIS